MNSQLSHKTRRYGLWKLAGLQYARGLSNFICFVERDASQFIPPSPNDPRQDDYDIWLGTAHLRAVDCDHAPWGPGKLPLSRRSRRDVAVRELRAGHVSGRQSC